MASQRFVARERHEFLTGAVGWSPGEPFDCLGPYAKVRNCPVQGVARRYTCYATGYADTMFSVPAYTRIKGKHVAGFFTLDGGGIMFVPCAGRI